ncbi:MAG: alpha/beta fold hydrolase [Flavobacteriales bacterium]|jgi:esterase
MKLFRQSFGQGQPLIILHGLFGSGDNWLTHAKALSAGFHVIVADQRNHGRSPHDPLMSYEAMSADLLDLIAEEGLRDIILVGHSMGGKTAMHFTREYHYLVDKLVVVDMGIRRYPPHHDRIFQGLFAADVRNAASRKEVGERLSPFVADPATLQFLMKNLYWKESGKLDWRFNLPVLHESIDAILSEISSENPVHVPALFMRGGRSGYIAEGDFPSIRSFFPQAEFATVQDAGHWPHAEAPAEFLDILSRFIR